MASLGLITETNPLAPAGRTRRTFEQAVPLLELLLYRECRAPAARETIRVDGDTAKIRAWLAKARTKRRAGQLDAGHERMVATLFDEGWTDETAAPAAAAATPR